MDTLCKFFSLRVIWQLALHPDRICVWGIRNGAVDGTLTSTLQSIVTLSRPWEIPVPVDFYSRNTSRDRTGLGVALPLCSFQVLCNHLLPVHVDAFVNGINDSFVKELKARFSGPDVFYGLELTTSLACVKSRNH